jgi:5-methylcytosine-specific restriction enzyme A
MAASTVQPSRSGIMMSSVTAAGRSSRASLSPSWPPPAAATENPAKVGLTRGNKDDSAVWEEFAHDRARLVKVAAAIRRAILQASDEELETLADDDPNMTEAQEGSLLTKVHRIRERNKALVHERKRMVLRQHGRLCYEVCGFDYEHRYGERGRGFIEAHHTRPLATLMEQSTTRLEDLALLCANCHRMVHAARPWLTLHELRLLLREREAGTEREPIL